MHIHYSDKMKFQFFATFKKENFHEHLHVKVMSSTHYYSLTGYISIVFASLTTKMFTDSWCRIYNFGD